MRFLGRRVYAGLVVVLISVMIHGLKGAPLPSAIGVDTLSRNPIFVCRLKIFGGGWECRNSVAENALKRFCRQNRQDGHVVGHNRQVSMRPEIGGNAKALEPH